MLSAKEAKAHLNAFISSEQADVKHQAQRLLSGVITPEAFFAFMREKIQAWHTITGVLAYGGQGQMDAERWARIHERVQSELSYLDGFQQQVEASFAAAKTIASKAANAVAAQTA